jgi:hypothetical protein
MMPTAAITAFMVGLPHYDRKSANSEAVAADVKSAMYAVAVIEGMFE